MDSLTHPLRRLANAIAIYCVLLTVQDVFGTRERLEKFHETEKRAIVYIRSRRLFETTTSAMR